MNDHLCDESSCFFRKKDRALVAEAMRQHSQKRGLCQGRKNPDWRPPPQDGQEVDWCPGPKKRIRVLAPFYFHTILNEVATGCMQVEILAVVLLFIRSY